MAQDFISAILGSQPDYSSILSPQQSQQLRTNANLNAAIGAIVPLLSLSGPQMRPVGTGQALGAALGGAFGGYTQGFDRTLQQIATGMQLESLKKKQEQQTALQNALALPDVKSRIEALQNLGQYDVVKNIAESQKALRQSGLMRDETASEMPSPIAPYLNAESPNVKTLATQLDNAYKSGILDEETLLKRIEPLARMEEAYVSRQESRADRASMRAEAQAERVALREEQATKLSPEQQKQITGAQNTVNAIKEFKDELQSFDPRSLANLSPASRAKIQTKYRNMQLQAKEAYNLGVLNGPDLTIIEQLVADPTSYTGALIGKKGIEAQASELSRIIKDIGVVASQKPKSVTEPAMPKETRPQAKGVRFLGFE